MSGVAEETCSETSPLEQDTKSVTFGGPRPKLSLGGGSCEEERSLVRKETLYASSSKGYSLAEEELPYSGYLVCTEHSCNNSHCFTERDLTPKVGAEDNEQIDVNMELALALALD